MDISLLKKIGFPDKSAAIYLALLRLGPSSVRNLAEKCELNRGTTYDALKWLQDQGVVNYYQKDTKQLFVAEDPERLKLIMDIREKELLQAEKDLYRCRRKIVSDLFHGRLAGIFIQRIFHV
jgi:sugar-specific transcriptional regulator TrmB